MVDPCMFVPYFSSHSSVTRESSLLHPVFPVWVSISYSTGSERSFPTFLLSRIEKKVRSLTPLIPSPPLHLAPSESFISRPARSVSRDHYLSHTLVRSQPAVERDR